MFLSEKERDETIWACRFCMMCQVVDRVAQVVKRESYSPRGRGAIVYALDNALLDYDESVADIMYTTLNDRLLQEWCVGNYDHDELVIEERARVFKKNMAPEEVSQHIRSLKATPVRGKNPEKILSEAGVTTQDDAETLLFCGIAARRSRQATLMAAGKLFNLAGVPFKVLSDEPSSGWALYQLGDFEGAKEFSVHLAEKLRSSGVTQVVVLDADCYGMLLGRTGRFGGDLKGIKIVHINRVLADWIKDGRFKITKKIPDIATYHDPCVLARFFEDIESPRLILNAVLENDLKEMATNKKLANCCGAGGMLTVHRPDVSEKVARLRLAEASETEASLLVSGCPRCDESFQQALTCDTIKGLRVVNLIDLVAEAAGMG